MRHGAITFGFGSLVAIACALAIAPPIAAEDPADKRAARLKELEELSLASAKLNSNLQADREELARLSAKLSAEMESFGRDFAPKDGALVLRAGKDGAVLLAGGTRDRDGVTAILGGRYLAGDFYVFGGDGGARGRAGRTVRSSGDLLWSISPANAAGTDGERGEAMVQSAGGEHTHARVGRNGTDAEAGDDTDLPGKESLAQIGREATAVSAAWKDVAGDEERRRLIEKRLRSLRPSTGVVACWSDDGIVCVVIGANGTERNPNGLSVEVVGTLAEVVIAIAGDAGPKGKPGRVIAPKSVYRYDGRE
ncbi:MAG: hypothetical protein IT452_20700 [Planctomycetia bacterium]|nr:hypothetical protein [Planctomycetia bacterium]